MLDGFNFNLDVASFYKDENIFRGKSDFSVSSSEISYDYKDHEMPFIQYATRSMSRKRILAKYGAMDFESLGMITDSTDEKVLLVSAGSDYATAANIADIIQKLQKDYGQGSIDAGRSYMSHEGVKLLFKTEGKLIKFVIEDIALTQEEDTEHNEQDSLPPFDEKSKARLMAAVKEKKEDIHVMLFMVTPMFDEVLHEAGSFSGDLTRY